MTNNRWITTRIRQQYAENMLDPLQIMELCRDALHDLDLADVEIKQLREELRHCVTLLDTTVLLPDGSNADTLRAHAILGDLGLCDLEDSNDLQTRTRQ